MGGVRRIIQALEMKIQENFGKIAKVLASPQAHANHHHFYRDLTRYSQLTYYVNESR